MRTASRKVVTAMAPPLDTTVGGPTSNSYCDVVYADAFWQTRLYADAWTGATADQKAAALVMATRLLDELPWKGQRIRIGQSLRWPRAGMFDRDGIYILQNQMPRVLLDCTAELAGMLLKEDRTEDEGALGLSMVRIGSLQVNYRPGRIQRELPDIIMNKISHWLSGFGSKLVRC